MQQLEIDWLVAGLVFAVGAIAAPLLVKLNLRIYRTIGLTRFAAFWQSQTRWWVPAMRLLLLLAAIAFSGKAVGLWW